MYGMILKRLSQKCTFWWSRSDSFRVRTGRRRGRSRLPEWDRVSSFTKITSCYSDFFVGTRFASIKNQFIHQTGYRNWKKLKKCPKASLWGSHLFWSRVRSCSCLRLSVRVRVRLDWSARARPRHLAAAGQKKFRRAFFDRKKFLPSSQFIRAIESGSTAVVVASSRKTSASLVQLGVGTVENQM